METAVRVLVNVDAEAAQAAERRPAVARLERN